jgi:hypothetical protein
LKPASCCLPTALQDAHNAFQAVTAAAKVLQDTELRSALDAEREDRELRAKAQAAAIAEERARAWRVARGEEAPSTAGPGNAEYEYRSVHVALSVMMLSCGRTCHRPRLRADGRDGS